jgi:hypothetical protein
MHPVGKGLYLRGMPADERRFVKMLATVGMTWVVVEGVNSLWLRHHDVLRSAGLQIWVSYFPHPWPFEEKLDLITRTAQRIGAAGLLLDPERGYTAEHGDRRRALWAAARARWEGSIGVTSFPSLPAEEFSDADWGSPQAYDRFDSQDMSYVRRSLDRWRAYGFKTTIPSLATYACGPSNVQDPCGPEHVHHKPLERFMRYLASVPAAKAACFWTLPSFQLHWEDARAHWEVLRAWEPDAPKGIFKLLPFGGDLYRELIQY